MILLVDDEPAVARLYGALIQRRGFNVRVCPDGEEALELMRHRRFHLVLCDVEMPGIGGHEVSRRMLRDGRRSCPFVLLSAHDSVASVQEGLAAGADDFLLKGTDLSRILDRITFWLSGGFRSLPMSARSAALDRLEEMAPNASLLSTLDLDAALVREALEVLHREVQATPPAFGMRLIERIRILGRASALLMGRAEEPAHFLRFPDALLRLVHGLRAPWTRDVGVLLAYYDLLARDPRFRAAGEEGLAPG